jgi:hypothetical protein
MIRRVALLVAFACAVGASASLASSATAPISVEANILVTTDIAMAHTESDVAVSPVNAKNVVGATTVFADRVGGLYNKTYASLDGGYTWSDTTPSAARGGQTGDPRVVFTNRGSALFVSLSLSKRRTEIYRSTDGGTTWSGPAHFKLFDHELIAVDRTSGRFSNRVYLAGEGGVPDKHAPHNIGSRRIVYLYTSGDDGRTFALRSLPETGITRPGDPFNYGGVGVVGLAVLNDGTVVLGFARYSQSVVPYEANYVALSTDGGKTFGRPMHLYDQYFSKTSFAAFQKTAAEEEHAGDVSAWGQTFTLAADASRGRYADRIYAVSREYRSSGSRVFVTYSADRGKTWSPHVYVSAADADEAQFMPEVAVSDAGAVAVSWFGTSGYPRRDHFNAYAAISTDGGRTFSAPALVSSLPSMPRTPGNLMPVSFYYPELGYGFISAYSRWAAGGDYVGLASGPDGVFHLYWPDSRGAEYEIYSARIHASGPSNPPATIARHDVTKDVMLDFDPIRLDVTNGEIDIPIRLRNVSGHALYGPVSVEFLGLQSALQKSYGRIAPGARLLDATSGGTGYGATFDYSHTLGSFGELPSGGVSEPIVWRFRVSDVDNLDAIGLNVKVIARY